MRNAVGLEVGQKPDAVALINRMDFSHCIYLLSVCRTERLRVAYSLKPDAPQQIFEYLENK